MASPKTWDLINSFVACLQAITVANGFNTNAGNFVTQERPVAPETQEALVVVELESVQRAEELAMVQVGRLVTVAVVVMVPTADNTDAQQKLHELIDDALRALENRQNAFPEGTQFPRFLDARVIPPAAGMEWIGAALRFSSHVRRT